MSANAKAAHGSTIAIEAVPIVAGTFTVVAELTTELAFEMTRRSAEVTAHSDTIDFHVVGAMLRSPITFGGNFVYDNAQHDHATGLQKHYIDGDTFGLRFGGPDWAADQDEIIMSGHLTAFSRSGPAREGPYEFSATFQPSGPMEIDGVAVT